MNDLNLLISIWRMGLGKHCMANGEIDYEEVFQITRHPVSWDTKEAQKWIDEMTKEKDYRRIWIDEPTIGY